MGKLNQLLQLFANVGLIAGLVLVSLQIRQNTELTQATLASEHMDGWASVDRSLQSETFAETLAKAISDPENLTDAQMLEMHGYLLSYMDQFRRTLELRGRELVLTDDISDAVKDGFGNRYALAWWKENRRFWPAELSEIMDGALTEMPQGSAFHREQLARIRATLRGE